MVTIYWQGHANAITSYDAILFKNSTFRRKLQYDSILFCTRCRNPIIGNNTKKQGKNHKLFPCFFFAPCRPGQPHRSHCVPMNINHCGHGTFSVGVLSFERNAPCTPILPIYSTSAFSLSRYWRIAKQYFRYSIFFLAERFEIPWIVFSACSKA